MVLLRDYAIQINLIMVICSGHLEACKWLVANRASLDAVDYLGRKPLDIAEENLHSEVVDFFRSCEKDLQQPGSSFSRIRSGSKNRCVSTHITTLKYFF